MRDDQSRVVRNPRRLVHSTQFGPARAYHIWRVLTADSAPEPEPERQQEAEAEATGSAVVASQLSTDATDTGAGEEREARLEFLFRNHARLRLTYTFDAPSSVENSSISLLL